MAALCDSEMRIFTLIISFIVSINCFAQGEYRFVDAENLSREGVGLRLKHEKELDRWCAEFVYPSESPVYFKEGYFDRANYLLKKNTVGEMESQSPSMYFELASNKVEGDGKLLSTEFCLATKYYIGAEFQLHYDNRANEHWNYTNVILWVQNIDKAIEKTSHNK